CWPADSRGSPEYRRSVSAVLIRNCVRRGIPPGTACLKDAIHPLNVLPVLVIPSAIDSRPRTVWKIRNPRYPHVTVQKKTTVSASTRRNAGQRRSGYSLIIHSTLSPRRTRENRLVG